MNSRRAGCYIPLLFTSNLGDRVQPVLQRRDLLLVLENLHFQLLLLVSCHHRSICIIPTWVTSWTSTLRNLRLFFALDWLDHLFRAACAPLTRLSPVSVSGSLAPACSAPPSLLLASPPVRAFSSSPHFSGPRLWVCPSGRHACFALIEN